MDSMDAHSLPGLPALSDPELAQSLFFAGFFWIVCT
jgi:hypothetical protein